MAELRLRYFDYSIDGRFWRLGERAEGVCMAMTIDTSISYEKAMRRYANWSAENRRCDLLDRFAEEIGEFLAGKRQTFSVKVAPIGSAFELKVWNQLMKLVYGTTATYGDIAKACGLPKGASRAIGGAVGRNPLLLVIPCHRVVGCGGRLGGFSAGIELKQQLLKIESSVM